MYSDENMNIYKYNIVEDLTHDIIRLIKSNNQNKIKIIQDRIKTSLNICELYMLEHAQSIRPNECELIKSPFTIVIESLYDLYVVTIKSRVFYNYKFSSDTDLNIRLKILYENIEVIFKQNKIIL